MTNTSTPLPEQGGKVCKRCGDKTPTIDNLIESTFTGFLRVKTTTTTEKSIGVGNTYIKGHGINTRVSTSDEEYSLCSDCWGLLIGYFLQGRDTHGTK